MRQHVMNSLEDMQSTSTSRTRVVHGLRFVANMIYLRKATLTRHWLCFCLVGFGLWKIKEQDSWPTTFWEIRTPRVTQTRFFPPWLVKTSWVMRWQYWIDQPGGCSHSCLIITCRLSQEPEEGNTPLHVAAEEGADKQGHQRGWDKHVRFHTWSEMPLKVTSEIRS